MPRVFVVIVARLVCERAANHQEHIAMAAYITKCYSDGEQGGVCDIRRTASNSINFIGIAGPCESLFGTGNLELTMWLEIVWTVARAVEEDPGYLIEDPGIMIGEMVSREKSMTYTNSDALRLS